MPPRRQTVLPDKICEYCGGAVKQKRYANRRYAGGIRLEARSQFQKRRFCSRACARKAYWENKHQSQPTPAQAQDDNKVAVSPPTQAAEPAPRQAAEPAPRQDDEPLSETLARAIDRHPELLEMLELVCR